MKGVAVKTLFLIVVLGMIIFFSLVLFWHWLDLQMIEASKTACTVKYMNYCERCIKDGECPGDWDQVAPEGCENDPINIYEPTLEDCQ